MNLNLDREQIEKIRYFFVVKKISLKNLAKLYDINLKTLRFWKSRAKALGDDWEAARLAHTNKQAEDNSLEDLAKEIMKDLVVGVKGTLDQVKAENLDAKNKTFILANLSQSYSRAIDANKKLMPRTSEFATAIKVLNFLVSYLEEKAPNLLNEFSAHIEGFSKELEKKL